jgi:8-oxo-dGTP pyrophosphatase MutT (NUDIX family)
MLKKIYFGDKPLFLAEEKDDGVKRFLHEKNTEVIKDLKSKEISSLITKMQEAKTHAGVILNNVTDAFNALKKEFTVIQASGGLVYDKNRVLLIFRRGKWDLPKGKLDDGEDLGQCALREIKEETGIGEIKLEQTLCTTYHTYYERGQHILKESHWHLVKGDDTEPLIPQIEEDIDKCEWININDLSPYIEKAPASIVDVIHKGLSMLKDKNSLFKQ